MVYTGLELPPPPPKWLVIQKCPSFLVKSYSQLIFFIVLLIDSSPSFSVQNGYWSVWHYLLTSFSPLPISILMLIAAKGWSGFLLTVGPLPLPVLLLLIGEWWLQLCLNIPCCVYGKLMLWKMWCFALQCMGRTNHKFPVYTTHNVSCSIKKEYIRE